MVDEEMTLPTTLRCKDSTRPNAFEAVDSLFHGGVDLIEL
jgi:hypothetical protein